MSNTFKNRVFGCVVIKSVNSNYNADFSHQPRTLPDGSVYATDKALKYTVRNYIDKNYPEDKVFYFKSLNGDMQPRDLDQNYARFFGDYPKADKKEAVKARKVILGNLLSCLDVRLFGGTFASKTANLSIHGVVQPTHGVNRYVEGIIYSEQGCILREHSCLMYTRLSDFMIGCGINMCCKRSGIRRSGSFCMMFPMRCIFCSR